MTTKVFPVEGMSCASCSARVDKTLRKVKGVADVSVSLPMHTARVSYDETICTPSDMAAAVAEMGFTLRVEDKAADNASATSNESAPSNSDAQSVRSLVLLGVCAAFMLVPLCFDGQSFFQFLVASFVLVRYARTFYRKAWQLLRHGSANMDTLVALSTCVAYTYSLCVLFAPTWFESRGMATDTYFDSVGIITFFVLLGRRLEARAMQRTTSALRELSALRPATVTRIFPNGSAREVALSDVSVGDILVAHPGESIAADGEVTEGVSAVDESMLSGEPVPVAKQKGDKVSTGTVNRRGLLHYRAVRVGGDTLLAQIIRMVGEAQGSRVPVQRLVDRIAAVFVPTVLLIAVLTLGLWLWLSPNEGLSRGLVSMVSVLVIACPCSLGLATPTALIVSVGRGAKRGILIKDAVCLETAKDIDTLVLDKTGTLTEGRPTVTDMHLWATDEARAIALSLERNSLHPLAEAVCRHLNSEPVLPITDFVETPGQGISAKSRGTMYYMGNVEWIRQESINFTAPQNAVIESEEQKGHTLIALADKEKLLLLLALTDKVKDGAKQAIDELRRLGVKTVMLTGDRASVAARTAAELGIDSYEAACLPSDKARCIRRLQQQGQRVAMAGDGINDSAALAAADLSIAMGGGSDIAIHTAQMTLLSTDICRLPEALRLSRTTFRTIGENLFWAFLYNVISIPVAAGALYPFCGFVLSPMVAGAAMAMSSVSVVLNSLRPRKI